MEPASSRKTKRDFSFRAFTTLITALAFLVLAFSGAILYSAPRGRVANWTGWSVLGLEKEQWSEVHILSALLVLVAIGFHLYFNWKPLCSYLKSKSTQLGMRLRELAAACAVTLIVVAGTIWGIPPFGTVVEIHERIQDAWEPAAGEVGRAPSTIVQELSVREFTQRMGLSPEQMRKALAAEGIDLTDPETPIDELARQHGTSLQRIYEAATPHTAATARPRDEEADARETREGRFGQLTLGELCRQEGIDLEGAVRVLEDRGVEATGQSRIRDLADQINTTPRRLMDELATHRGD